jgi:TonB family protein
MGFVVNQDGSISDVVIRRGLTADIDSEGMRVIRLLPRFSPGRQDGKAVRVSYTLPISFKLKPNPADTVKKYKVVEHMPVFPGGDSAMMRMVQISIRYPDDARENDIQGRVVVGFVVMEDGSIDSIKIKKSVTPSIDAEAIRIVKLFPKFKPGTQQGKPVRVSYILPIMFALATDDGRRGNTPWVNISNKSSMDQGLTEPVAWGHVSDKMDVTPQFTDTNGINSFLQKNLKYPIDAQNLNIAGTVIVGFIVNEDGHLSDFDFIHKDYQSLNKEAMRVAKLLPPFKPGMKDGKPVKTLYKLPVTFGVYDPSPHKPASEVKIDIR